MKFQILNGELRKRFTNTVIRVNISSILRFYKNRKDQKESHLKNGKKNPQGSRLAQRNIP